MNRFSLVIPVSLVGGFIIGVVVILIFRHTTHEIQPTQPIGSYSGKLNTFRVKMPHHSYADCVEISTSHGVAVWCR